VQLHQRIKTRLDRVKDRPFIQFHDALQYFEKEFELSGGYFFTTGVEHKVGIRQLRTIRERIRQQDIRCVFYEPPVKPAIIDNLVLDQTTKVLPLEPIGIDLTAGADLYFQLMDNIARQLAVCLEQ
jgi:zinc transport system substrate-binding protein